MGCLLGGSLGGFVFGDELLIHLMGTGTIGPENNWVGDDHLLCCDSEGHLQMVCSGWIKSLWFNGLEEGREHCAGVLL